MSLFNFFRRPKNAVNNPVTDTNVAEPVIQVDRALFVDDQAPELKNPVKKASNPIEVFLDQNFEWEGYNDGYGHPETDYLDNKLSQIRSEFRLAVDKCMDARRNDLGALKLHLIDVEDISGRLEAKLREKIKQLEVTIHELDTQKILSVENEGIVSTAISAYRLGFVKGLERYQQEKFFGESTGLFN